MTWLLSILLKVASSGLVDKAVDFLKAEAVRKTGDARIRADVQIAQIQAAVSHTQIMADLQKSKFQYWAFWALAAIFIVPLAGWWNALIIDSIFLLGWGIATVPILEEWGGQMISFLFYTGTVVGALKILK